MPSAFVYFLIAGSASGDSYVYGQYEGYVDLLLMYSSEKIFFP